VTTPSELYVRLCYAYPGFKEYLMVGCEFSGTTERIFTKFSSLAELCGGVINPAFIGRLLKERSSMATNFSRNTGVFGRQIFIIVLAFRNGLEYRNIDEQLRSIMNVATLYTNFVRFGAVTLEKRLLIFVLV